MKENENISLIQQAVCYNQYKLSEYIFESASEHKRLKEFVRNKNISSFSNFDEFDENDSSKLLDLYYNLQRQVNGKLKEAFEENFEYLISSFKDRSDINPRICVKAIIENKIHTLFRDRYLMEDYPQNKTDNTAFNVISGGKRYYLNNNIPRSVQAGTYKNSRIIKDCVTKYKEPGIYKKIIALFKSNYTDEDWIKCWRNIKIRNDDSDEYYPCLTDICYKSTLVVPMSLLVRNLSDDFKKYFKINKEKEKALFGFLCLDHQDKNFFVQNKDVAIAYIFADILSLYLIQNINYTSCSSTFNKVRSIIPTDPKM